MSITTDRNGLEVLDLATCLELLASQPVGRIAWVEGGRPVVLPVNHVLLGSTVCFRTATGGKLDAAVMQREVAYEVDDHDERTRTGWSVLVRGQVDLVTDEARLAWLGSQGLVPWADPRDPSWASIRAEDVSGRRVRPDLARRGEERP